MRGGVDIESAMAEFVGYIRGDKDAQAILLESLIGPFRIFPDTDLEAVPQIIGGSTSA